MPATERTCSNCIYYFSDSEDCHFNPPQSVVKFEADGYSANWPAVDADEWCGQWAPDFALPFYPGPVA